ncbi:MAG: sporulation protein YabP [Lachnospiraceae bacterium]|nr:sporulation protein YabP [Lachnospiraceae bacterium]
MENLNTGTRSHKITVTNRAGCSVSGVNDVLSFDEHEVLLETTMGMLSIKGKELHVNRLTLDKGEIDIDGRVDSCSYSDTGMTGQKQESLMSRLFR